MPFVEARLSKTEIEIQLFTASDGFFLGLDVLDINKPHGFGFFSSSIRFDREKEDLWCAYSARFVEEHGFVPLIVPIDEYYSFLPHNASISSKCSALRDMISDFSDPEKYVLILSGFTQSVVFNEMTLKKIPSQENARFINDQREQIELFDKFIGTMSVLLYDVSLETALNQIQKIVNNMDIAKFILTSALLLQDKSAWQRITEKGPPLWIVAPSDFHLAMNRFNVARGHGKCDYIHRANLGRFFVPPFDEIDGEIKEGYEYESRINITEGGISKKEFNELMNIGMLKELIKLVEDKTK